PNLLKTSGGSAIKNLLLGDMRMLKFPLPPFEEQEEIITQINVLVSNCDALEAEITESKVNTEKMMQSVLTKWLGDENNVFTNKIKKKNIKNTPRREVKYNSKTLLMDLVKILKENGKLHAEDLWKMSKYPNDIDEFYAKLKEQIEEKKTIKESLEKGYLELA
ncbi:MAG: restriction endonuclease subunit S, partial [Allomuricauda sp.]